MSEHQEGACGSQTDGTPADRDQLVQDKDVIQETAADIDLGIGRADGKTDGAPVDGSEVMSTDPVSVRIRGAATNQNMGATAAEHQEVQIPTHDGKCVNQHCGGAHQKTKQATRFGDRAPTYQDKQMLDEARHQKRNALTALSKKKTSMEKLMKYSDQLHLVKNALIAYKKLYDNYTNAYEDCARLWNPKDAALLNKEGKKFDAESKNFVDFTTRVNSWIIDAEREQSDLHESASLVAGRQEPRNSSRASGYSLKNFSVRSVTASAIPHAMDAQSGLKPRQTQSALGAPAFSRALSNACGGASSVVAGSLGTALRRSGLSRSVRSRTSTEAIFAAEEEEVKLRELQAVRALSDKKAQAIKAEETAKEAGEQYILDEQIAITKARVEFYKEVAERRKSDSSKKSDTQFETVEKPRQGHQEYLPVRHQYQVGNTDKEVDYPPVFEENITLGRPFTQCDAEVLQQLGGPFTQCDTEALQQTKQSLISAMAQLGLRAAFTEFAKSDGAGYVCLVSISTSPPRVFQGEAASELEAARITVTSAMSGMGLQGCSNRGRGAGAGSASIHHPSLLSMNSAKEDTVKPKTCSESLMSVSKRKFKPESQVRPSSISNMFLVQHPVPPNPQTKTQVLSSPMQELFSNLEMQRPADPKCKDKSQDMAQFTNLNPAVHHSISQSTASACTVKDPALMPNTKISLGGAVEKASAVTQKMDQTRASGLTLGQQMPTPTGDGIGKGNYNNREYGLLHGSGSREREHPDMTGKLNISGTAQSNMERHSTRQSILKHVTLNPEAEVWQPSNVENVAGLGSTSEDNMALAMMQQTVETNRQIAAAISLPKMEIKKFNGNPLEFYSFQSAFMDLISGHSMSEKQKLRLLQKHVEGQAADLMVGAEYADDQQCFVEAWHTLVEYYGSVQHVASAHFATLKDWKIIAADDVAELRKFSAFLLRCMRAVGKFMERSMLDDLERIQTINSKLPLYIQYKWNDNVVYIQSAENREPQFSDFVKLVQHQAKAASHPVFGREAMAKLRPGKSSGAAPLAYRRKPNEVAGFSVDVKQSDSEAESCFVCAGNHDPDDCKDFSKLVLIDRRKMIYDKNRCYKCYGTGHHAKDCKAKRTCKKCHKSHPTLLHNESFKKPTTPAMVATCSTEAEINSQPETEEHADEGACMAAEVGGSSTVYQAILPVLVHCHRSPPVVTYALFDNGSGGCFVTMDLMDRLGLQGSPTMLKLRTMHGESLSHSTAITGLQVSDINGRNTVSLPRTFTREEIPVCTKQIARPDGVRAWPHLAQIANEIHEFLDGVEVGMVLGVNCPLALQPMKTIASANGGPFATLLKHGWAIHGPCYKEADSEQISINKVAVKEIESIKEAVVRMFDQDYVDSRVAKVPDEKDMSMEDKQFLQIMEEGVVYSDGKYVAPLPFRKQRVVMPDNRYQAYQRAMWQRKRMLKDEEYRRDYTEFVAKMIDRMYVRKITEEEKTIMPGGFWYLPHHAVRHPQKNKLRVVFDASAMFQGVSLNSSLLQGPNLTANLIGVLCRFRQYATAFMADIESMFFQVRVVESQQQYLRFLWWDEGDLTREPVDYCMNVHTFGAISSPSIVNYILKITGEHHSHPTDADVRSVISQNFYVDDALVSFPGVDQAVSVSDRLVQCCQRGGFNLTKFSSNSTEFLQNIPKEKRADESNAGTNCQLGIPLERALGLYWDVKSDTFQFYIRVKPRPPTRRGILTVVSSIYDPLGFLSPIVLPVKRLLQSLCKDPKLDWDDMVSEEQQDWWKEWLTQLPMLDGLSVKRCIMESGQSSDVEAHVFCDASTQGTAASVFLRMPRVEGGYHTSFLLGKARVPPSTTVVTIPRLELTAAVLAVKLASTAQTEMNVVKRVYFYSDSQAVLKFINTDTQRQPIFIANRIQVIRTFSEPDQWQYINTTKNPADCGSRGLTPVAFLEDRTWIDGPEFLKRSDQENQVAIPWEQIRVGEDQQEINQMACSTVEEIRSQEGEGVVNRLFERFSSWFRLKKAVAALKRLMDYWRRGSPRGQEEKDQLKLARFPVTVQELKEAEKAILRCVQSQVFPKEIQQLRSKGNRAFIGKESELKALNPGCREGLLCVGGRLSRSDMSEEEKHPVILPKKHWVVSLIIWDTHRSLGHVGRNHVLSRLRRKFWITGGLSAIRRTLASCTVCRRKNAYKQEQIMSDLPACRTDISRPFEHTGVDYFGPFSIREGRRDLKRFGVLFTCMASRACHLEVASSLDVSSFIHALRRFTARRGPVKILYSDNGTNFTGAERELKVALASMEQGHMQREAARMSITWKFNPPAASHMGGCWERLIRTTRGVLSSLLREFGERLNQESLITLLCEAENIINSRPLTTVSASPEDLDALTPGHLLTMKAGGGAPLPGDFRRPDLFSRKRWRQVQYLASIFWTRWRNEFVTALQRRSKWTTQRPNLEPGDIVMIEEDGIPRGKWPLGKVIAVENDSKENVRAVTLKTKTMEKLRRPITKLVLLVPAAQVNQS